MAHLLPEIKIYLFIIYLFIQPRYRRVCMLYIFIYVTVIILIANKPTV